MPHSHEAKFRHLPKATALPQISAIGRSLSESRGPHDRAPAGHLGAGAGRRVSAREPNWLVPSNVEWGPQSGDPHRRPNTRDAPASGMVHHEPPPPARQARRDLSQTAGAASVSQIKPLVSGIAVIERPLSSYSSKRGGERPPPLPLQRSVRDREASLRRAPRSDPMMIHGHTEVTITPTPTATNAFAAPAPVVDRDRAPASRPLLRAATSTDDGAEERRAERMRHEPDAPAHRRPTKSSSRQAVAPMYRQNSSFHDRSLSYTPQSFDDAASAATDGRAADAESRLGDPTYARIAPEDFPNDSDSNASPEDECDSPFYGVRGALSPW